MKAAIFTEVFLGKWLDFTHLSKNLIGGAEVYLYELATGPLKQSGYETTIFQTHGEGGRIDDRTEVITVETHQVNLLKQQNLLITNNGFSYPPTSQALIKVRRAEPDQKIINLHHGSIVKPTLLRPRTFGYWRQSYLAGHPGLKGRMKLFPEVIIWELRRISLIIRMNVLTMYVDKVVSVDAFSLRYLVSPLRKKWQVILNAADLEMFQPQPRPTNTKKIILVPRNLRYERGIPLMPVVAWLMKQQTEVDFEFWITGTGPAKSQTEDLIHLYGVDEQVKLIGHQDHFKDMPKLYRQSDIVVVPTFCDEGTSLSVIEAMASNRPVVTTNVGGINDIGVHMEHKLSSNFDAQQMADHIVMLLEDQVLVERLCEQAIQMVKERHDLEVWSKQWQVLLRDLQS